MHANSLNAYSHIKHKLSVRQQEVIKAFEAIGQATDEQIADYLHYTVNRVTGRITELKKKGVVLEDHNIIGKFGKTVRVCRLVNQQTTLF